MRSYVFAFYRTFLSSQSCFNLSSEWYFFHLLSMELVHQLCVEVVFFCSVWKSYFFALYGSRKVLLSMEVVLFCSVCTRTFFLRVSLFSSQSYFFPLNRTFFPLSRTFFIRVVLFSSHSYFIIFPYLFALLGARTSLLSTELVLFCFFTTLILLFPESFFLLRVVFPLPFVLFFLHFM